MRRRPLFKTAVAGNDPNVGRLVGAVSTLIITITLTVARTLTLKPSAT